MRKTIDLISKHLKKVIIALVTGTTEILLIVFVVVMFGGCQPVIIDNRGPDAPNRIRVIRERVTCTTGGISTPEMIDSNLKTAAAVATSQTGWNITAIQTVYYDAIIQLPQTSLIMKTVLHTVEPNHRFKRLQLRARTSSHAPWKTVSEVRVLSQNATKLIFDKSFVAKEILLKVYPIFNRVGREERGEFIVTRWEAVPFKIAEIELYVQK